MTDQTAETDTGTGTGTAVAVPEPASIEAADPDTAALMVTKALEESKAWLSTAMEATDPTPIAEFKAWAATVEEAAKQKKLGREIELDAAEMVRRAERGLGQAIRAGQGRGEITRRGDQRSDQIREKNLVSPQKFIHHGQERQDAYEMTDGVDDEQFDEAVADAKDEGNLSRANVVRKTREQKQAETTGRWEQVTELAARGHSSAQIAAKVGLAEATVRRGAKQRGITIRADEAIGRTRRLDTDRVVDQTVRTLTGATVGLDTLINYDALELHRLIEWTDSLDGAMRELNRFARRLKHARKQAEQAQQTEQDEPMEENIQ